MTQPASRTTGALILFSMKVLFSVTDSVSCRWCRLQVSHGAFQDHNDSHDPHYDGQLLLFLPTCKLKTFYCEVKPPFSYVLTVERWSLFLNWAKVAKSLFLNHKVGFCFVA